MDVDKILETVACEAFEIWEVRPKVPRYVSEASRISSTSYAALSIGTYPN